MGDVAIQHFISEFRRGRDLDERCTAVLFDVLISSFDEAAVVQLLRTWNQKGFAESELFGLAELMRSRMLRVTSARSPLVDVVGTGGAAAAKTYNVSTTAAMIVAGAGIAVAKHGNRAATSRSGSADALTELGIDIAAQAQQLSRRLNKDGICFLFAPNHHNLSATIAAARRQLGEPTIFNCLGPLCNPASPTHSLIGVARREWLLPMARVVARFGTSQSWIVCGESGLDEVALVGPTAVAQVSGAEITQFEITSAEFGILPDGSPRLAVRGPAQSAAVIEAILRGEYADTDMENFAVMNAAAAIYVAQEATSFRHAHELALESLRSGSAAGKLAALRKPI